MTYKGVVVNGFDAQGGLWFSREVQTHREMEAAILEARALPEVVRVETIF